MEKQDVNAIQRAWGLTEWFDEYKNDQILTQSNSDGRIWTDMLDSALHNHLNTNWGNIFGRIGVT